MIPPFYHYVIVRKDLPLGVLAAQTIHAAGESIESPLPAGTHAICLAATCEQHLLEIASNLSKHNIKHTLIREPDEPWRNAAMAIGLAPVSDRKQIRKVVSQLPLLKYMEECDHDDHDAYGKLL